MRKPRPSARTSRARHRLTAEVLEDRSVPSVGTSFVNDNWAVITDVGPTGLSAGDTVRNDNDTINPGTVVGVFGTDAFSTINDAVTNTVTFGTVNVLEGAYSETVAVNKTLNLFGAQASVDARTRPPTAAETIVTGPGTVSLNA